MIKGNHNQLVPGLVDSDEFHALMCNPPFFEVREDEGKQSASNTSTLVEATFDGGEESFVSKLIDESFVYRNKIKLFTVMLGRKASMKSLKKKLQGYRNDNILNFIGTEFCQGKTIRWGLAWTFDLSLRLSSVQRISHSKKSPTFVHKIPETRFLSRYCYTLNGVAECILELLDEIKIGKGHIAGLTKSKKKIEFTIRADLNTWSHQRQIRRMAQRRGAGPSREQMEDGEARNESDSRPLKRRLDDLEFSLESSSEASDPTSPGREMDDDREENRGELAKKAKISPDSNDADDEQLYLLDCTLRVHREKEAFYLKMSANDRIRDKDSVHQLFQYFKNNLN